jgi:hypothetical protein
VSVRKEKEVFEKGGGGWDFNPRSRAPSPPNSAEKKFESSEISSAQKQELRPQQRSRPLIVVSTASTLITSGFNRHVFRRDCLAGHQSAILLFQAQVSYMLHPQQQTLTSTGLRKRRISAVTNTMSQAYAIVNHVLSPTPGTQLSARTQVLAPCTST